MTLNNSRVTGNNGFFGGGIENRGTLTLNGNSTVTGNTASDDGGGVYNSCGTLNGAVAGTGGNVFGNTPDDIFNDTSFC